MMRKPLALMAAASVLVGSGAVYAVGTSSGTAARSGAMPQRLADWRLTADHTTSRHWTYVDLPTPVDALAGFDVRSTGLFTAAVNANLKGAPVQLRLIDRAKTGSPTSTTFAPRTDSSAFSFTFVGRGKKQACGHLLRLQWRSPAGKKATLTNGDVAVTYRPATNDDGVCA